ncbi:Ig-like domain-containing protein [Gorillibacterium sp. sgz5001074]|uniref:Ig-like domain-containing protein n=1 Tax=Gorillibacterium sp. sgz5001074 TaxID=3446695 RepID=UPI003F66B797
MLRRLSLVLLSILMLGVFLPPGWGQAGLPVAQAAEDNLIQNGSFETYSTDSQLGWTTRRAANWGIWVDSASTPVAPAVTVELYHASPGAGSRSVKISSPAPNKSRLTVYQGNIPVVPGQEYRLSGAFKTQQITGDTTAFGVNIRVVYLNSTGQALRTDYLLPYNRPVRGNVTEWVSYATATVAPAGAVTARVDLDYNQVSGYAWFDDIQFKPWTSLKGLSFLEQGGTIPVGGVKQVPYQLTPVNASNPSLSWSSSNPGVAAVDGQGLVTGLAPGLATITAISSENSFKASYLITVTPAGLVKNSGFETVLSGSDNGFTDRTPSNWTASAPYGSPIVTVDEAVYGAGSRSLSISAAVNSKASAVQRQIPVVSGQWYRLSGLISTESLTGNGASLRLNWNLSGGAVLEAANVPATAVKGTQAWKSYEGFVQAPAGVVGASLYAIYETGKGKAWFDDVQLTPWVPVTGLTGDGPSFRGMNPGESLTYSASVVPSNATDQRVYWTSSQPEIAAVDASGKVTAKAAGQSVITETTAEGSFTKSYTVIVSAAFPNGGFETVIASTKDWLNASKPGSWIYYFSTDTSLAKPQLSMDSTVRKEGEKSVKMEAATKGKVVLYNKIVGATAGKSYRVGGWLKQENGGTNVSLRLLYQDDAGNVVQKSGKVYDTLPFTATTDADGWKYYESIVTVPAGATQARVEVGFELGTGTLWADDIQVIPWVPVSGIQLDKTKGLIGIGESVALTATVLPVDATHPVVSWTSDNPSAAVVEANGFNSSKAIVRGVAPGIATIRATADNPLYAATYTVIVGTDSDITASDEAVEVIEDQSITRPVLATDAAGDPLTASVLLAPLHGTVSARDNGTWVYYPSAEYNGPDTFTLLITDGHNHFAFSIIQVNVRSQQDAPSMDKLQVNVGTVRDQAVSGVVTAKDRDQDPLTFTLKSGPASQPQHGSAAVQPSGAWTYTPAAGYTGYDSFQIEVSDGHSSTSSAKVVVYVGLPGSEMISSLITRHSAPGTAHPRLYATSDDFTRIRGMVQTDPTMQEWYAKVKAVADKAVGDPTIDYYTTSSGSNINIVNLADQLMPRIQSLALMYQLTGDTKYSARAIEQLNVMADYRDWHGGAKNFLSISEMGNVASIGYDWLYDAMTQQERDHLRAKMINEVLINAKYEYLEGGAKNNAWWTVSPSNWNLVANGGIVATALTIGDEADANRIHTEATDPRFQVPIAESVMQAAMSSVQYGIGVFATDGDWPEGTGYWDYATEYFAYMISALRTTLGTDFGFMEQTGVRETSKYMANLHGPNGPFNYSDAHLTFLDTPQLLLFADVLGDPDVSWYRQFTYSKNKKAEPMDLIWYRQGLYGSSDPLQLDALYDHPLKNNVAIFRDSWNDPGANFVAIKGGVNDYAITNTLHNNLDVGTFVLDALGVRWAVDLGKDDKDYNVQGYFTSDPSAHPNRWDFYRTRAEGSNTLVINPDDGPDQALDANAPIIAYDSKPEGGYAVVDMTSAYKDDVVYAKRGMMMGQYRSSFLLQDELQLKAPSDLYWFMHTEAPEIIVAPDGKSAMLKQNGKRLYAQLLSPSAASFEVRTATPLPTTDSYTGQTLNAKVKKLTIHIPDAKDQLTIAVRLSPLSGVEAPPADVPAITPLAQWSLDSTPTALLSELRIDGVPFTSFRPMKMKYSLEVPFRTQAVPVITAVAADPHDTVTITAASGIPGTSVVEVTDDQGIHKPGNYYIDFVRGVFSGVLTDVPVLPVTYLADSGPVDNKWPGPSTADHDPLTYWAVLGPNTIDFDLGSETVATYVGISWLRGNERQFFFDILTSTDGQTWTKIFQGPSSGKVNGDYEIYDIPDTKARYLRLAVTGNNITNATSINEVMVYGNSSKPVTGISMAGQDGRAVINSVNSTLQMIATVQPADATNRTVTWAVYGADGAPTGAAQIDGKGLLTGLADGVVTVVAQANDGSGIRGQLNVTIDLQAPVTAAVIDPAQPDGANGWYRSVPSLGLSPSDNLTGVVQTEISLDGGQGWSAYTAPVPLTEGVRTVQYRSRDAAGNQEAAKTAEFRIDRTAPTVTFSVYDYRAYGIDEMVSIRCIAADSGSGVASSTCQDVSAPAYTLGLGTHTLTAVATDKAGNTVSSTVHYVIKVAFDSLNRLTQKLLGDGDHGVGSQLVDRLSRAMTANDQARAGMLGAFQNKVSAERGKTLTPEQADLLAQLADVLK